MNSLRWILIAVVCLLGMPALGQRVEMNLRETSATRVPNSWIVMFKPTARRDEMDSIGSSISSLRGGSLRAMHHSSDLNGTGSSCNYMHVRADEDDMNAWAQANVSSSPRDAIQFIEPEFKYFKKVVQPGSAPWNLDRIDDTNVYDKLDGRYAYTKDGTGVTVFVLDTGIRTTHVDFGGRARFGYDAMGEGVTTDCEGHGTHVAGTIGGATYGAAKNAQLVAVRVLDCNGEGSTSTIIAGLNYVLQRGVFPSIVSMSLGGDRSTSLDQIVADVTARGAIVVVAAGNEDADACGSSPADSPNAITVGASSRSDSKASYSNYGSCVNIFAPGDKIESLSYQSDSDTAFMSGTSMAAPLVSGVAALILQTNPSFRFAQVLAALNTAAITGELSSIGSGSPNRLLRTPYIDTAGLAQTQPRPVANSAFRSQSSFVLTLLLTVVVGMFLHFQS